MRLLLGVAASLVSLLPIQAPPGRISRAGVARAQAVVDSVFLDRKATEGSIEGGDWASYLMARLGVEPIPESTEIQIMVDSQRIVLSGRIQDLPEAARAMIGPLAALVDSSTVLAADIALLPAAQGLSHFRLEGVSIGGFPVPEVILRSMLLDVGEHYPALTKTGRDLYVEIPPDGRVTLIPGAVRLTAPQRPGPPSQ
ncbi:MAG TPA: hypothetical protein VGQ69_11740 [Gemmatimonadales bacterium]|jgi:hypothetical protein|nr:hypothetical protein [Gemmatimonadales bacterium]